MNRPIIPALDYAALIRLQLEQQKLSLRYADERLAFEADRLAAALVRKAHDWSFRFVCRSLPPRLRRMRV